MNDSALLPGAAQFTLLQDMMILNASRFFVCFLLFRTDMICHNTKFQYIE